MNILFRWIAKIRNVPKALRDALETQAKLRRDELLANTGMSRPMRMLGASMPILAGFIVTYQVYSSGDEATIIENTGVQAVEHWSWNVSQYDLSGPDVDACILQKCFLNETPLKLLQQLQMPAQDPVSQKTLNLEQGRYVFYETDIGSTRGVAYFPGIRAQRVFFWLDDLLLQQTAGDIPYFVDLSAGPINETRRLRILLEFRDSVGQNSFQGFIRKQIFVGGSLQVVRAQARLSQSLFPRQAVIIFLLSIGALTFAFFVFLDHKRELFALGLTISLLGAGEACRIGIVPFVSTYGWFVFFTLHLTALVWYTGELLRLTTGTPRTVIGAGLSVIALYSLTKLYDLGEFDQANNWFADYISTRGIRLRLLHLLDGVPIVCGVISIAFGIRLYRVSTERALQLLISAGGMIAYGAYLYAYDLDLPITRFVQGLNEVPTMVIVSTWIISALSSLGSMERRVQIAVKDREQRLKLEHEIILAQEVQQSFISPGRQEDETYEVMTVYKAVKRVGGDWVTWLPLGQRYSLGIIGDVVGKGVQAGLIVSACDSLLRNVFATINPEVEDPEAILRKIVEALFRSVIAPHQQRAMTAVIVIASDSGEIAFTSLGHPPILGINSESSRVITVRNSWLSSTFPIDKLQTGRVVMRPGETLVGFTDGVCDGSRQLRHFRERIKDWYQKPLEAIAAEFDAVEPDYDDQTLLLFRMKKQKEVLSA